MLQVFTKRAFLKTQHALLEILCHKVITYKQKVPNFRSTRSKRQSIIRLQTMEQDN
jgi:hypothetical protein